MEGRGDLVSAQHGSTEAFGHFYDKHVDGLLRWFRRRTASDEVTADLCAETFTNALASLQRFDPARGSETAWIYGIARNVLRQWHRRRHLSVSRRAKRGWAALAELQDDDFDMVDYRVDLESMVGPLDAALRRLTPSNRRAVWMRVVDEQPHSVIAAELGCSEAASRVRVSRALSALLDDLEVP